MLRSGSAKVTLTFWRRAHHCRLVSMATVTGDEHPAPALPQAVLVAAATEPLIVEDTGARAELRVPQSRSDVAVETNKQRAAATASCETDENQGSVVFFFSPVVPETQLPADHTSVSVRPVRVTHCPPLAIQVDLDTSAAGGGTAHQTSSA